MRYSLKQIKISATASIVTMEGIWGNPAIPNGADFGTVFFDITKGFQGTLSQPSRQLKFDSFNNSFISPSAGTFTLEYSDDTAFVDVTSSTPRTTAPYPLGEKGGSAGNPIGWYEYTTGGNVNLVQDFVMYVNVGSTIYAFAANGWQANGTFLNNQGVFTFEVKTL